MDSKNVEELKRFVEQFKANPSIIHFPSLQFFKDFLQSLGARIPSSHDSVDYEDEKKPRAEKPSMTRNDESHVELDEKKPIVVLEPDNDPPQKTQADVASLLQEGEVIGVQSASILRNKLDAASKASRLAVVYFTATWCGPCRYIAPEYTTFAKKYPKVVFLKADIDEAVDAAMEWNISSIPTFFFVKDGRGTEQLVSTDKNVLEKKIIQHAG